MIKAINSLSSISILNTNSHSDIDPATTMINDVASYDVSENLQCLVLV